MGGGAYFLRSRYSTCKNNGERSDLCQWDIRQKMLHEACSYGECHTYCILGVCSLTPRYPPKTECGCLYGGVIENGLTHNPLTLCSVPVLVHVQVWLHMPGDPQSVQLSNATTTNPAAGYHGCRN